MLSHSWEKRVSAPPRSQRTRSPVLLTKGEVLLLLTSRGRTTQCVWKSGRADTPRFPCAAKRTRATQQIASHHSERERCSLWGRSSDSGLLVFVTLETGTNWIWSSDGKQRSCPAVACCSVSRPSHLSTSKLLELCFFLWTPVLSVMLLFIFELLSVPGGLQIYFALSWSTLICVHSPLVIVCPCYDKLHLAGTSETLYVCR